MNEVTQELFFYKTNTQLVCKTYFITFNSDLQKTDLAG